MMAGMVVDLNRFHRSFFYVSKGANNLLIKSFIRL